MAPFDENYTPIEFDFVSGPIEAYASATSVKQGDTIYFHVWSSANCNFTITIKRKGLFDTTVLTDYGSAEPYQTNQDPWINGCGWPVRYSLSIPEDWQSGAYIAELSFTEEELSYTTEVLFFIKPLNPGVATKILFQSSVSTYQAYNNWGGKSLYDYNSTENQRSYKVSYNRPYADLWGFYIWDLPFIQWLEKEGYTVEFCTNVDLHTDSDLLSFYKLFLSVGHDEYWSWEMRDNIDFHLENNGNVAFFSGNTCWWQVRFEAQNGVDHRLLVCYKDANLDPEQEPHLKTINWYNPMIDRPENLMTGVSFFNGTYHDWGTMPDAYFKTKLHKHWLLKDTGLQYGGEFGVYDNEILQKHYTTIGYETDAAEYTDMDIKFPFPTGKLPVDIQGKSAPKDFIILASSNLTNWSEIGIGSSGYNNHNGWVTIGIYRKPAIGGGGFGFTVGTTNWSYGLLNIVENQSVEDPWNEIHQITKNVLDILGNATFQAQQFLLDNPDFEYWNGNPLMPDGWYQEGTGNISRISPGHSGSYCLKIDATNGQTWISQNYIPIRTNRQYRVKCWAKGSDPFEYPVNNITIRLQTTDDYYDFAIANYTGTEFWQEISASGIINSIENILRPARVKIQVASNVIAYFDQVIVEEL